MMWIIKIMFELIIQIVMASIIIIFLCSDKLFTYVLVPLLANTIVVFFVFGLRDMVIVFTMSFVFGCLLFRDPFYEVIYKSKILFWFDVIVWTTISFSSTFFMYSKSINPSLSVPLSIFMLIILVLGILSMLYKMGVLIRMFIKNEI